MKVTKETLDDLLEGIKEVAKHNRERNGFSRQFVPVVIVVGPTGEHSVQPMQFKNYDEKRALMKALSKAARDLHVLAILLVTDTYHAKTKAFSEYYGIPEGLSGDEWQDAYCDVLDKHLNGSLANAPKHLISDALVIAMKGPMVQQKIWFLPYHEGVGDSIRWDAEEPEHESEILMLEDWWDKTPVN